METTRGSLYHNKWRFYKTKRKRRYLIMMTLAGIYALFVVGFSLYSFLLKNGSTDIDGAKGLVRNKRQIPDIQLLDEDGNLYIYVNIGKHYNYLLF